MKNKKQFFLDVAYRCSLQGTCLKANYGAVVVDDDDHIISTGYTGMPKGIEHCKECVRKNVPSGTHYEKCRSVHAEMNALIQAGKEANDCTLYLSKNTLEENIMPCYLCAKMIVNSGIKKIITPKNEFDPKELIEYWDKILFMDKE